MSGFKLIPSIFIVIFLTLFSSVNFNVIAFSSIFTTFAGPGVITSSPASKPTSSFLNETPVGAWSSIKIPPAPLVNVICSVKNNLTNSSNPGVYLFLMALGSKPPLGLLINNVPSSSSPNSTK